MTTNIVPTYPGVYVESVNKLALSVGHSATAVPVFAVDTTDTLITEPVRITSWMDYSALRINSTIEKDDTYKTAKSVFDVAVSELKVAEDELFVAQKTLEQDLITKVISQAHKDAVPAKIQALEKEKKEYKAAQYALTKLRSSLEAKAASPSGYTKLDKSLRTYFENGGGYCWLMPASNFELEIPKHKDITLLVAAGQDIKSAVATLCVEGNGLFAILDADKDTTDLSTLNQKLDESEFSAAYFPWLDAQWNGNAVKDIPPSAAMAGIYCQVDASRGVWKAPANVALKGGLTPQVKISDDMQGQLNKGKAINMIRDFGDGTPMVWGARTCQDDDHWRYVPVRRLFNSAERDIRDAMKIAMFEPNSQPTWERVKAAITRYLNDLWQAGALAGQKPEEAFFVDCGKNVTMDETDINQGKMIVKIGMAAVRPAEFIILQFTQDIA